VGKSWARPKFQSDCVQHPCGPKLCAEPKMFFPLHSADDTADAEFLGDRFPVDGPALVDE